jgi:hypothetical protein
VSYPGFDVIPADAGIQQSAHAKGSMGKIGKKLAFMFPSFV